MAKGNLILGTASRSIGDVTMYRRNGQQVSRARVRKIGNPRTEGQAKQRMLQAALTRFYSPLTSCLEKSFEGKNKMDSYSKFLAVNNRIGRNMFAVPKNAGWVPVPVKVSGGTMPSPNVSYNEDSDAGFLLDATLKQGAQINLGTISQAFMDAYGLSEGDQVTIIAAINRSTADEPNFTPVYFRFFLKPASVDAVPSFGGVSIIEQDGTIGLVHTDDALAGVAVIFSRYENNAWRRSNSFMVLAPNILEDFTGTEGIAKWLDEWMNGTTVPTSEVYLNGSTESPLTPHAGSVTITLNGTSYTFIGAGHKVVDNVDAAYFITSEGDRLYIKNNNEKSDAFGKIATFGSMQTEDLSQMKEATQPAGIKDAECLSINPLSDAYTGDIAESLVEFASSHGWKQIAAAMWFGKYQ